MTTMTHKDAQSRETKVRQRSRHNARKHGIFADILLSGDEMSGDRADYLQLLAGLREAIRPIDGFEDLQIQKLALLYVRLSRAYKADARIAPMTFARVQELLDQDQPEVTVEWVSKEEKVVVARKDPTPDLLIRYESALERQIGRTLTQIEQWRRMRQGGPQSADGKG